MFKWQRLAAARHGSCQLRRAVDNAAAIGLPFQVNACGPGSCKAQGSWSS
jgi:hypothetical protein